MDRGMIGRLRRPPNLDMESYQELVTGLRKWANGPFREAARLQAEAIYGDRTLPPGDAARSDTRRALAADPVVATRDRVWASVQQMTWKNIRDNLGRDEHAYLAELDAADPVGPGSLTLDPGLHIPEYARHEIHLQPGGYVGDDLGGHVFYWGTNNFYEGQVYQDDHHRKVALSVAAPADGVVGRVVDLGCGIGRVTLGLKEHFPDAEVWGVDLSRALLRYAHKRAVDLDIAVHYTQQLAEALSFADDSIDVVASYILFHEVPTVIAERIYREAYRVLRPGGVFHFFDFHAGPAVQTPYQDYARWIDDVFNDEVWAPQYLASDPVGALREIGFDVEAPTRAHWEIHGYKAVKPRP